MPHIKADAVVPANTPLRNFVGTSLGWSASDLDDMDVIYVPKQALTVTDAVWVLASASVVTATEATLRIRWQLKAYETPAKQCYLGDTREGEIDIPLQTLPDAPLGQLVYTAALAEFGQTASLMA